MLLEAHSRVEVLGVVILAGSGVVEHKGAGGEVGDGVEVGLQLGGEGGDDVAVVDNYVAAVVARSEVLVVGDVVGEEAVEFLGGIVGVCGLSGLGCHSAPSVLPTVPVAVGVARGGTTLTLVGVQ
jgi:hypothetical protein